MITRIPTLTSSPWPCSSLNASNLQNPLPRSNLFPLKPSKIPTSPLKIQNSTQKPKPNSKATSLNQVTSCPDDKTWVSASGLVSVRMRRLVSEFRSLTEPIDRVRRLLDYAGVLPGLGESTSLPEIRVPGCAAQLWLEVERDELGRMRFRADSDSEITKGFCSCLIFLLDGAFPLDVLKVKVEDLADMNVGLPVRSRVNSWHNVLINMQERTEKFLTENDQEVCQLDALETFPLVVSTDSITSIGKVCVS